MGDRRPRARVPRQWLDEGYQQPARNGCRHVMDFTAREARCKVCGETWRWTATDSGQPLGWCPVGRTGFTG